MDPFISEGIEIIKSAAPIAAGSLPFTGIVKRMLGPAADELAEMWRDSVRLYRYRRQIKCIEKAEKIATDAGYTPKAVPIKILFPLLEGASLEEDETLHDMWAALLANASSPDGDMVKPGFLAILKQMTPDEVALLSWVFDKFEELGGTSGDGRLVVIDVREAFETTGFGSLEGSSSIGWTMDGRTLDFESSLDSLVANQLICVSDSGNHALTSRGFQFVSACRVPGTIGQ